MSNHTLIKEFDVALENSCGKGRRKQYCRSYEAPNLENIKMFHLGREPWGS